MSAVLIVEDERHLAEGLRYNLEAEGYDVRTVADGESALDVLVGRREAFDVVVLDVMLPGKDGFAVASELREAGEFVPVLMLTARGRPEDVLRGFESGADDYLPKPFDLSVLIARLNGLLRRREWFHLAQNSATPASDTNAGATQEDDRASVIDEDRFAFDGRTIDFERLELQNGDETM